MIHTDNNKLFTINVKALVSLVFTTCLLAAVVAVNIGHANEDGDPRGLVIVMHKDIDVSSIADDELQRLFTGKSRRLPNGARAALASYGPESSFFNEKLLGLSDAEVAALWSKLRFAGRTPPPRTFNTVEALVKFVSTTPNALAYMPASASRLGVRVISNLPR